MDADGPLVDGHGRGIEYLRLSLTDRCNYRCTYCRPAAGGAHLDRADRLDADEIVALVSCFVRLGVRRIRLTGGEPTLRTDLVAIATRLQALSVHDLALSTNGHLLAPLASPLRAAGISRLNVSLDTLDAHKFSTITRGGDLSRVLAGIDAARAIGLPVKLNTVAVKGFNDLEIPAIAAYAWSVGAIPRFIEQMPMADGDLYVPGALMTAAEVRASLMRAHPDHGVVPDLEPGIPGVGPARYHRLVDATDPSGAPRLFGIISPMTEHFCDTCNRLRLSASGQLHTCLGHDDAHDLRALLHAGGPTAVTSAIRAAVAMKRAGHTFQLVGLGGPRKSMVSIGG